MIIQKEEYSLRKFSLNDISWYYTYIQNEELKRRLPNLIVYEPSQAREDLKIFSEGDFKNDFYYVIVDSNDKAVGIIIATRTTRNILEIAYFLSEEYRGKGIMQTALADMMRIARKVDSTYEFKAVIDSDNAKSLNVMKRMCATIVFDKEKYYCYL